MRVVAGSAKGRRLKSPPNTDTRPVMDRVKTALFDILTGDVVEARFLDLFAGTGSIGIEALSRGATFATFVELGPDTVRCVRENLAITGLAAQAEVLRADAFRFVEQAHARGTRYDIVYVAPPQYQSMASRAIALLDASPLTESGGLVVAQIHPREHGDLDALALKTLEQYDERKYGSTLLRFYQHHVPDAAEDGDPE